MRRKRTVIGMLAGVLVSSLAFAAPAQAVQNPPAPKGGHLITSGSGTLATTVSSAEVPVTLADGSSGFGGGTVTITPEALTNGRRCSTASVWEYATNVTHTKLWQYTQTDQWCWDTGTHRVVSVGNPAKIAGTVTTFAAALGWSYAGVLNQRVSDYYGDHWVYDVWSQGHFDYCPPRVICVQHSYPQLTLYLYGDGHYDAFWY